jgi:hypothetical protein
MNNRKLILKAGGILALLTAMAWLHVYAAPSFHLPDYDTHRYAWNARQLAAGHFNELFHHLAPLYQLTLAAVWLLFPRIEVWIALGAVVYALACIYWCSQTVHHLWQRIALFLLLQLTPLLFYHNGGLQTTPFYFLGFTVWWQLYRRRPQAGIPTRIEAFWWGVCLALEYKSIFWLSGLWLYDARQFITRPNRQLLLRYIERGGHVLWVPVLLVVVGTGLGVPWWRYPAAWIYLFFRKEYLRQSTFDVLFHFKYLLHYEPVALIGILATLLFWLGRKKYLPQKSMQLLCFIALWLLLLMSFLPKAPRGILLSLVVGYTFFVQGVAQLLPLSALHRKILTGLGVGIALGISAYRLLPYATYLPPYKEAARRLSPYIHEKQTIHSVLCLAPALYLPMEVSFQVHFKQELNSRPLLVSDAALLFYSEEALHALRKQATWTLPHPFLGFPLLHLESAEFYGQSYEQALELAARLKKQQASIYFLSH